MKKLTPIIVTDALEPCLPFWTDRLGFEVTATVPHDDRIGFAILKKGVVEIMYQSRASVEADVPGVAEKLGSGSGVLFIEVESVDEVERALGDAAEIVVPRRQTFYGMDEIFVSAPCGTVVGFAAPVAQEQG